MSAPVIWLIILLSLAIVMFVLELFVPSGGLLAIAGALALTASVAVCFSIDRWLGVGAMVAIVVLTPFVWAGAMSIWPKTPMGRRLILTTTAGELPKVHVLIGSMGTTMTEMRPMGEVEVGETKLEANSEMGIIIPAGRKVKVISLSDGVATVREVKT